MDTYDIKLIAMDMDGTLLNSKQQISPENHAALMAAREKGIFIAICSGRLPDDAGLFALENDMPECTILALNGAYCQMKPLGVSYANHTMADDTLAKCIELLNADNALYACFAQNKLIAMNSTGPLDLLEWSSHNSGEGALSIEGGMSALTKARKGGINKIVYFEPNEERLLRMKEQLCAVHGLDITSSWAENLELMPAGITKGAAVMELAKKLGFKASQVMTIGDYDNDVSMIACAGLGVAMGNATEVVKSAAAYVALTNDENGVAEAIKRFVLK